MKTADLVFERLKDWGVSMVFGMPGMASMVLSRLSALAKKTFGLFR